MGQMSQYRVESPSSPSSLNRGCVIKLSQSALEQNLSLYQKENPQSQLLISIKANGYGHGLPQILTMLQHARESTSSPISYPISGYMAATFEEVWMIRHHQSTSRELRVLLVGPIHDDELEEITTLPLDSSIELFVYSQESLRRILSVAKARSYPFRIHLKIDTGMGRLGFLPEEIPEILPALLTEKTIQLCGIATHFANANNSSASIRCQEQVDLFLQTLSPFLEELNQKKISLHAANSMGLLRRSIVLQREREGTHIQLDRLARVGLGVMGYGYGEESHNLAPVMQFCGRVHQIKKIPAGEPLSYDHIWRSKKPTAVAILGVGYGDGYSVSLSNRGEVLIRGERYPVVGKVCMDQMIVEIGLGSDVQVSDEVILWGERFSEEETQLDWLSQRCGLSTYSLLCGVTGRVPRIVV